MALRKLNYIWNYRSNRKISTHDSGLSMCGLHTGLSDALEGNRRGLRLSGTRPLVRCAQTFC